MVFAGTAFADDPCNFAVTDASTCSPGGSVTFSYDVTEDFGGLCYTTNFDDGGAGGFMNNFTIGDTSSGCPTSNSGAYICPVGGNIPADFEVTDVGGFCGGATHMTVDFSPMTNDCPKNCASGGSVTYHYFWGTDNYGGGTLIMSDFSSDTGGSFVYDSLAIGEGETATQTFNCPVVGIDIGVSLNASSDDVNYPVPTCLINVLAPTPTPTPTPTPVPVSGHNTGRRLMGVGN